MRFEWDADKNTQNKKKHNVDFQTASYVFSDKNRVEFYDKKHSVLEDRFITIGRAGKILFVVFSERNDNIRIISARLATLFERKVYYGESNL